MHVNQCSGNTTKTYTAMAPQVSACLPGALSPQTGSQVSVLCVTTLTSGTGFVLQGKNQDMDFTSWCSDDRAVLMWLRGIQHKLKASPGCWLCCKGQPKHHCGAAFEHLTPGMVKAP